MPQPSYSKSKKTEKPRSYRSESGQGTLSKSSKQKKPARRAPSPVPESDSEAEHSDSSVLSFLSIDDKEPTSRPAPKRVSKNKRDTNVRQVDAHQEAEPKDESTTVSQMLAIALSFRTGFNKLTYPERSEYIPDARALFGIVEAMNGLVSDNSVIHEKFPAFTSVGLTTFYAHAVFFKILLVRDTIGVLTRDERRALRKYEAIGPAESWSIGSPVASFFQALGTVTPPGGKFGPIVPCLPEYSAMLTGAAGTSLARLHHVASIGRLPIVPALHEFMYAIGAGTASFTTNDIRIPVASETLGAAAAQFMGITDSSATSAAFHVLTHSAGWNEPTDSNVDTYAMIPAQKVSIINKWKIPSHGNAADLNSIDKFLGLDDAKSTDWIRRLLELSSQVNNFFPGSVNLANIPNFTTTEIISEINMITPVQTTLTADKWYVPNPQWKLSLKGKTVNDDSQFAYQMALTNRVRPTYNPETFDTAIRPAFADRHPGATTYNSYFHTDTTPRQEMECLMQPDPIRLARTYIQNEIYQARPSN